MHDSYTTYYKEVELFNFWYGAERPSTTILVASKDCPTNSKGSKPTSQTVSKWITQFKWHDKAKGLDAEASDLIRQDNVKEKVEMAVRHTKRGKKMQEKAWDYFEKQGISSDHAAMKMLVEGIRIEKESRGISSVIEKLTQMDDEKLMNEALKLIEDGGVIIEPLENVESESEVTI